MDYAFPRNGMKWMNEKDNDIKRCKCNYDSEHVLKEVIAVYDIYHD